MEIRYEEIGECIELYIDDQFIKLFNAYPELYQNRIAAEVYVKTAYFTNQKS